MSEPSGCRGRRGDAGPVTERVRGADLCFRGHARHVGNGALGEGPVGPSPRKPVSGFSAPQPDAMMQQVMQLTPAQLAQLPPDRRAKIEALRARIAQGLVPGAPPQPTAADINML